MLKKFFFISVVTALSVVFVGTAFSQGFGRMGNRNCMLELNLTEEQQAKMEKMRLDFQKETVPLRNEIQMKNSELQLMMISEKPDQKKIDKKIEEIKGFQEKFQKKRAEHHLAIRNILTEEQQTFFDQRMLKRGYGFGMGHGGGKGFCPGAGNCDGTGSHGRGYGRGHHGGRW